MSQQIALRFFVACGLAVGVVACGGDKPDTQPQSGAKVGDAAKDAGKGVADAGKAFGKAVADLGKSVGPAAAEVATDAGITAAVNTRLKAEMLGDGMKVSALTNEGVVTLKGSVPTREAKSKAETIAKSTSGVKRVVNQLDVK